MSRPDPPSSRSAHCADRVGVEPAGKLVDEFLDPPDRIGILEPLPDQRPAVELLDRGGEFLGELPCLLHGLRTEEEHDGAEHDGQHDGDQERGDRPAAPQPLTQDGHDRVERKAEQHTEQQRCERPLRRSHEPEHGECQPARRRRP